MKHLIIHSEVLSPVDMANLKEFNREHHPIIVTVVYNDGYSKRFKITEECFSMIMNGISSGYMIIH